MEVRILGADDVPKYSQVCVSSLGTKRFAPLSNDSTFHFQKPMVETKRTIEVAVLEPVASGSFAALSRGVAKVTVTAKDQPELKYGIVTLEIFETQVKNEKKMPSGRMDGIESRKYLRETNVVPVVQSILHSAMKERPSNPLEYMRSQVLLKQAQEAKRSASQNTATGFIEIRVLKTENVPSDGKLGFQCGSLYKQVRTEAGQVFTIPCPEDDEGPFFWTVHVLRWLYGEPVSVDEDTDFLSVELFDKGSKLSETPVMNLQLGIEADDSTVFSVGSPMAKGSNNISNRGPIITNASSLPPSLGGTMNPMGLSLMSTMSPMSTMNSISPMGTMNPMSPMSTMNPLSPVKSPMSPSGRIEVTIEESGYLANHKAVMRYGQDLIQQLIVEAPADPYDFMIAFLDHLMVNPGTPFKTRAPKAPLAPAPKSRGPRSAKKTVQSEDPAEDPVEELVMKKETFAPAYRFMPSVGTWQMPKPSKLPNLDLVCQVVNCLVKGAKSGSLSVALDGKKLRTKARIGFVTSASVGRLKLALKVKSIRNGICLGLHNAVKTNRLQATLKTPEIQRKVRKALVKSVSVSGLHKALQQVAPNKVRKPFIPHTKNVISHQETADEVRIREKAQIALLSGLDSGILEFRLKNILKGRFLLMNRVEPPAEAPRPPEEEQHVLDEWIERPSVATWYVQTPLKIDGPWQPEARWEDKPSVCASMMRLPLMVKGEWSPAESKAALASGIQKAKTGLRDALQVGTLRPALEWEETRSKAQQVFLQHTRSGKLKSFLAFKGAERQLRQGLVKNRDKYGRPTTQNQDVDVKRDLRAVILDGARTGVIAAAFNTVRKQKEDELREKLRVPLVKAAWFFGLQMALETSKKQRVQSKLQMALITEAQSGALREKLEYLRQREAPNENLASQERTAPRAEQEKTLNEQLEKILVDTPVAFTRNTANLKPEGKQVISKVAALLRQNPDFVILCEGHCMGDNDDHRMKLSADRSKVCKEALQDDGVRNEIATAGHGSQYGLGMCVKMKTVKKASLHVKVTGASGLPKTSLFGDKMNPQVTVKLGDDKKAVSAVHEGGHQAPTWNFEASLGWAGEPLWITVENVSKQGKATLIGTAILNLSMLAEGHRPDLGSGDLELFKDMKRKSGKVNVAISWPGP